MRKYALLQSTYRKKSSVYFGVSTNFRKKRYEKQTDIIDLRFIDFLVD